MGAGIAQVSAQAGFETVGREVSDELCERARGTIEHYLGRAVEKEKMTPEERDAALGRLTFTTKLEDLAGCDLVIEAIVEELEPKRETFGELERVVAPGAILASNTSAIPIHEIAAATDHPERVIGMHFFNPAPLLPLVEIIKAERSSDEAVNAAYEWAEQAGKQPVRANDTPGFIVNRVIVPTLNECIRLLDEGITPEDLDKAMTMGDGLADGPLHARRPRRHRHPHPRRGGDVRGNRRRAGQAPGAPPRDGRRRPPRPQDRPGLLRLETPTMT